MSLNKRLKDERAKNGLSQQKLAELSNTHYSNIGRYERGDAKPSADVINRIAQVLEVSPEKVRPARSYVYSVATF